MEKSSLSIRVLISASFIVLLITTFSVIGYFTFSSWNESADEIMSKMEKDANDDIVAKMDQFIQIPLALNEANHYLIENQLIDLADEKEREKYFCGVMKSSPQEVYSFSYGTELGQYYGARRNQKNELEIMQNDSTTNGNTRYYAMTHELTLWYRG